MAEKELVIKEKLEHSGIFDFKGFYSFAHAWFKDELYGVVEKTYSEKVSGNARDIEFEWTVTKKLSDYFKTEMKVEAKIKELTDVEVEIDGQKKRMNKGKVSFEIDAALMIDPESKWDVNPFYRFLRDIYSKYVIPKRVDNMKNVIFKDVTTCKEEIKAFLELSGRR